MNFNLLRKIPLITQQIRTIANTTNALENFLPTNFTTVVDVRKNLARSRSLDRYKVFREKDEVARRSSSVPPNVFHGEESKVLQYYHTECLSQARCFATASQKGRILTKVQERNFGFLKKLFGEPEKKCPVPIICEKKVDKKGNVSLKCIPYDFKNPPNKRKYETIGSSKSELAPNESGKLEMDVKQLTYKKEDVCEVPTEQQPKGMPVIDFTQLEPECKPKLQPDPVDISGPSQNQTHKPNKELDTWECREACNKFSYMDKTILCESESQSIKKEIEDKTRETECPSFYGNSNEIKNTKTEEKNIPVKEEITPCVIENKLETSTNELDNSQQKDSSKTGPELHDNVQEIKNISMSAKSETMDTKEEIKSCELLSKPEPSKQTDIKKINADKESTEPPCELESKSGPLAPKEATLGQQPEPCPDNWEKRDASSKFQEVDIGKQTNSQSLSTTEPYKIKYVADPYPRDPNEEVCPKLPFQCSKNATDDHSCKGGTQTDDPCQKIRLIKALCPKENDSSKQAPIITESVKNCTEEDPCQEIAKVKELCPKNISPTDDCTNKNLELGSCPRKNDQTELSRNKELCLNSENPIKTSENIDPCKKNLSACTQTITITDPKGDEECEKRDPTPTTTIMRDPGDCNIPKKDPALGVEIREPKSTGTMICDNCDPCDPCKGKKNKCDPGCPESRKPKRPPEEGTCNRFCPDDSAGDELECRRCRRHEICEDPIPKPKPIDCAACLTIENQACPTACPPKPRIPKCPSGKTTNICCPKPVKPKPLCRPKRPPCHNPCPEVVPQCPTPNVCCHEPEEDVKFREPCIEDVLATEDKRTKPCPVKIVPSAPPKPPAPEICPGTMSHTNWVPVPIIIKRPGATMKNTGKCGVEHEKKCAEGYAAASKVKPNIARRTPNLRTKLPKPVVVRKNFLDGLKGLIKSAKVVLPGAGKRGGKKTSNNRIVTARTEASRAGNYLYKIPEIGDDGKLRRSDEVWPFLKKSKSGTRTEK